MHLVITGRIDAEVREQISRERPEMTVAHWRGEGTIPRAILLKWVHEADAVLCMLTERIDQEFLDQAPHLRIVSNMAVGYDNLDLPALTAQGILATNTPDVLTESTAELAMALMLVVLRRMRSAEDDLRQGLWTGWSPDGFLGAELYGKTLGLIGFGRIAGAVLRRAQAFGMAVQVYSRRTVPDLPDGVHQVDWETVTAESDIISLHVPLSPSTYHMLDASALARMRRNAVVINTARGPVVDESALVLAIAEHRIAGAGLDVFEQEPLSPDSPLLGLPGVVLLPHIGSATVETRRAMARRAWTNIRSLAEGKAPADLLNPAVWPESRR